MIVRSSSEVPRRTLAKRFPLPRNFGLGAESRVERGKTWPAPGQASRVKIFEIYRYYPDSGGNPSSSAHSTSTRVRPALLDRARRRCDR
jgi:succinate dehydrogenase / fumarate reductase iron-sulfur subunit